ncbi:4-(cytidine 5'-diphospho)-2-C-methyl-D-erythritol kinase [Frigidibacter sp. MR17.14]|uniref:4-(cytidine 5'-diphospho)-2-C-methyl-D-erythritol kinase n=1 Tax=Frigidibacter sp. MR17.14 TaxID=3126509 RepID=UPI003012F3FF
MPQNPGFAPAKINLALHVCGQRADGYHLLDSLVVFAGVGDHVRAADAPDLSLAVTGPRAAGVPTGPDNLVLRAARLLDSGRGAALMLDKHLPAMAGIGGGSSDAAAALRVLARLWSCPLPAAAAAASLGADVPVCLDPIPQRMRGIGEVLTPLAPLPETWLVLLNPGVPVATPAIFRSLARRDNAPLPETLPRFTDAAALARFLTAQRNDLQPPAEALAPAVTEACAALDAQPGCLMSRMSGSGATCFGLFAAAAPAEAAAATLRRGRPGWWLAAAPMLGSADQEPLDQETRATT